MSIKIEHEEEITEEQTKNSSNFETKNSNSNKKWYIIKCPSGVEEKFIKNLKENLAKYNMEDELEDFFIPKYEKPSNTRSIMAIYLFIKINLTKKIEDIISSIKYASFMLDSELNPTIVDNETILNLKNKEIETAKKEEDEIKIGCSVLITNDKLFKNFEGTVEKINEEEQKAQISISILGTSLSVELPFTAIKIINN